MPGVRSPDRNASLVSTEADFLPRSAEVRNPVGRASAFPQDGPHNQLESATEMVQGPTGWQPFLRLRLPDRGNALAQPDGNTNHLETANSRDLHKPWNLGGRPEL